MDTTKEIPIIFPLSSQGRLNRSTAFIYPAVERFLSTSFVLLAFVYYSIFQSEFFPKEQSVEKKANFLLYMIYGYLQKLKKKIPQYLQNSLLMIRFLFEIFYTVIKAANR